MKTKKKRSLNIYLTGGKDDEVFNGALSILPSITGLIDTLSDNDPRASNEREPLINMATTRNMINPYATGGEEDDSLTSDLTPEELEGLQQVAEEQGLTIEELIGQLENNIAGDGETSKMAMGGNIGDPIKVAKTKADVLTANTEAKRFAKSRGLKYADSMYAVRDIGGTLPQYVDANNKPLVSTPKAALPLTVPNGVGAQDIMNSNGQFYYNDPNSGYLTEVDPSVVNLPRFKKPVVDPLTNSVATVHAYGGRAKSSINVEDDEVLQTPNGHIVQAKGAKHEQGGIDVNVPSGTKIYSDRLKVGGKSMQERKLAREAKLNKLLKLTDKNPVDQTLKNTLKRTSDNLAGEENRDMAIQKVAKKIYQSTKYALGGIDEGDDPIFKKFGVRLQDMNISSNLDPNLVQTDLPDYFDPTPQMGTVANKPITGPRGIGNPIYPATKEGSEIGVGDAIGLAGNAFNAIAPIINTNLNRRATKPNINRFRGYGNKAITANDTAQDYVAGTRSSAISDISTSANSAYSRNRNSAQSVTTQRALDISTDMAKNKAVSQVDSEFSRQMMGLLSERGRLENDKDLREMTGETARDLENKSDTDNYYSNMGANLVNLGTNVQGIGKNINQASENKTNRKLISQLSKYGLTFDNDGNLVTGR